MKQTKNLSLLSLNSYQSKQSQRLQEVHLHEPHCEYGKISYRLKILHVFILLSFLTGRKSKQHKGLPMKNRDKLRTPRWA